MSDNDNSFYLAMIAAILCQNEILKRQSHPTLGLGRQQPKPEDFFDEAWKLIQASEKFLES